MVFAALFLGVSPARAATSAWNVNSAGWSTAGSWNPATVPNAIGDTATFGNAGTNSAKSVTMSASITLGVMNLTATGNRAYSFFSSSATTRTLTFDVSSGNASLNVSGSQQHIIGSSATNLTIVALNDSMDLANSSSGAVGLTFGTSGGTHTFGLGANALNITGSGNTTIHSQITGTGGSILMGGSGILNLTDTANSFTGNTTLNSGTLQLSAAGALTSSVLDYQGGTVSFSGITTAQFGGLAGDTNLALTNTASAAVVLTINGTVNTTYSGVLGGLGNLTKNGTSNLTLDNANSYAGNTIINTGGMIIAANDTALGGTANGTTVASGGALALQGGIAIGAEALNLSGTGVSTTGALRNLSGTNTYGGAITIGAAGTEIGSDAGELIMTGTITGNAAGRTLIFDGAGNLTANGAISTNITTLTKNGGGLLTLNTANSYTGNTLVVGGTVAAGDNGAFSTTTIVLNGGNIAASGGARTLTNSLSLTTSSGISGAENLTLAGVFTLTTGNATLTVTNTALTEFSNNFVLGPGNATNRFVTLNVDPASGGVLISGVVQDGGTGADGLTKNGGGLLTLTNANTYTNTTTLNAGTLAVGNDAALGTGTLLLNGGTLAAVGGARTLTNSVSLTFSGATLGGSEALSLSGTFTQTGANSTLSVTNTAATTLSGSVVLAPNNQTRMLTFNVDGASGGLSITGVVQAGTGTGADGIVKNGGGLLTLGNANTYNGTTTINAGTLAVGNDAALGTNTTILNGGTLMAVGGLRTLTNSFSLTSSGGTLGGSEALSLSGTFTQTGTNTTLSVTNTAATTISGGLVLAANNQARTLTIDVDGGSGGLTVSGVVQNGTGSGVDNVAKAGGGLLVFGNTNTYNGTTTIDGGTLSVAVLAAGGTNSGIGNSSAAAANLVLNGGSLQYTGGTQSTNRSFMLGTAGGGLDASGSGALTFSNTTAFTVSGTGDRTFTLSGNNTDDNTFATPINNASSGTTSLTKDGTGKWVLTGNSGNFSGATLVNAGTLAMGASDIFAGAITVNGGTLDLATFNDTVGLVTLQNGNISSSTGVLTGTDYIVENGTVSAILAGSGNLTKQTGGTVYLTANNTYSGNTTITGGILSVGILNNGGTNSGIGSSSAAATSLVLNGGLLQYTGTGASINRTFTVGTAGGGLDASGTGTLTFSNTTALTIASTGARTFTLTGNNTSNNTINATLNNSTSGATSLVKDGDGTWLRTGGGNYTGGTTVYNGVLLVDHANALGSGTTGVTVEDGGTLGLLGGRTYTAGNLTLSGAGEGGVGALWNVSGNNTWGGNISIAANATINSGATSGTVLTLGSLFTQNLTLAAGKDVTFIGGANTETLVNAHIIGAGNVTIDTSGTVHYYSDGNTYTGTTYINNGKLIVDTPNHSVPVAVGNATLGIQTAVVIGDGTGTANTSILQLGPDSLPLANEVMSNTTAVTINQDGRFWLNNQNQTIGTLTMNGGNADSGVNGILFLNGDVDIAMNANASVISGVLSLTGHNEPTPADRLFTVAGGGNATQLVIDAIVQSGGFTKDGDGTMLLSGSGDNTFTGDANIDEGIVRIAKDKALGAIAGATYVADGAQLQLTNNITVTGETLHLNGTGISNDGALQNLSGNNTWNGTINLQSNASIESLTGNTFTHSGTLSSSASHSVTFEGAGHIRQSGTISSSIANITKNDGGTLTLSGTSSNAFTGTFTINGGTVDLAKSDNTSAVSGTRLTVNSGGTLLSSANEQISNSTNMTLNGGSWFTQGNDETLGTLTLTDNSVIDLGSGSSIINFANSSAVAWTGGTTLTLENWSGVVAGGGTDQVYFGSSMGGLTGGPHGSGQIAQIKFLNPTNYAPGLYDAQILSTGEVVPFFPVPEPSTYAAGAALALLAGAWEYRRRKLRAAAEAADGPGAPGA